MNGTVQLLNAVGVLLTALGGLIVTIKVFIPLKKTAEVTHTIVNQQRTDMQNVIVYQKKLIEHLQAERDRHGEESHPIE